MLLDVKGKGRLFWERIMAQSAWETLKCDGDQVCDQDHGVVDGGSIGHWFLWM